MEEMLFFLSYAKEDDKYKKGFVDAINPALKAKLWRIWQDGEIMPGANWDENKKKSLADAEVIVLLVSDDFLNSQYVIDVELKEALERHNSGTALVIPVILDGCLWDLTDLKGIKPVLINDKIKKDAKSALQEAARRVLESVNSYKPEKFDPGQPAADALKPEEIGELRQLDPEALLIAVRQKQEVCILPPNPGKVTRHKLSPQGLSAKVLGILQRLMLTGDLEEADFQVLGEALFHRLFPDAAARDAFIKAYQAHAPQNGKPLKILLHFDDQSNDLAGLPWEYLWLPLPEGKAEGFFIGEKENLILTRRLSATGGQEKKVEMEKLRILIAFSRPPVQEVADRISADAQSVFNRSQPQSEEDKKLWENIEVAGPQNFTTQGAFEQFLQQEGQFHIVHFIGKGKTDNGSGRIAFCDNAAQKEEWLSPDEFVKCFPDNRKPNLLFLHAPPDSCRSLRDMALNLVTQMDGILAIQTHVTSEEAADFSEKLYTALAKGRDLDEAVVNAARFAAARSANRLRMYGLSASFSRATLKMEVARPVAPVMAAEENFIFLKCPNHDDPDIQCKQTLPVRNGRTWLFCKNPRCDAGPLWLCPNCRDTVVNLSMKRCLNCGYETANMVVPDDIRKLIPAPKTEGTQAAPKPNVPGTMTDRTAYGPQESRRAEPGLPR